jgi:hypothetical protein
MELKKSTLKNLKLMEDYFLDKEKNIRRSDLNKENLIIKRNIDNLNLAFSEIKRLDLNMGLSRQDWEDLDRGL